MSCLPNSIPQGDKNHDPNHTYRNKNPNTNANLDVIISYTHQQDEDRARCRKELCWMHMSKHNEVADIMTLPQSTTWHPTTVHHLALIKVVSEILTYTTIITDGRGGWEQPADDFNRKKAPKGGSIAKWLGHWT